jgi:hypothetical protein
MLPLLTALRSTWSDPYSDMYISTCGYARKKDRLTQGCLPLMYMASDLSLAVRRCTLGFQAAVFECKVKAR